MECCLLSAVFYISLLTLIYKSLDWLVRLPRGRPAGQYVLITGCDTGFGNQAARRLDSLGCHVIATVMTSQGEAGLRAACSGRLSVVRMDVSQTEDVQRTVDVVRETLPPGEGLWGLVNNAGTAGRTFGPVMWLPVDQYHQTLSVNLLGLIDLTTRLLPLIKRSRGRIVNVASVHGRTGLGYNAPYSVSKYGVEAYSDVLRRELRVFGVSVHLIEPGFHSTNIINHEDNVRAVRGAWEAAPPEEREAYGDDYIERSMLRVFDTVIPSIMSPRTSDVVSAYEHALFGVVPRARYVVGFDAKYIWLPLQWVPEWAGDWVQQTLAGEHTLPAACRKQS